MFLRQEVILFPPLFSSTFVDIMQDSFSKALPAMKACDDFAIQTKV